MNGASLTGPDLYDWMALRRVSDGGVTKLGGCWLERGHRVPGYVTDALTALRQRGLVTLTDHEPGGMARAVLTENGTARFEHLCQSALGTSGRAVRFRRAAQGRDDTDL